MSSTRRRVLVSYLALAIVVVGAVAHALLPLAMPAPVRVAASALIIDADDVGDRNLLPGAYLLREGQPQRPARADSRAHANSGAIPPAVAAVIEPGRPQSVHALQHLSGGHVSTRTDYRPRDPPVGA
jgi:hypothetical protein